MKVSKRVTAMFQEGGVMAPEAGMAPPAEGGDPLMQLVDLASQALQSGDCDMAMGLAEGLLALVEGAGAAPAPAPMEETAPVFKKGGKLVRRVKRA